MTAQTRDIPSKKAVRRAGGVLRLPRALAADLKAALCVLSRWRASFYQPVMSFQALLHEEIKRLAIKNAFVSLRLKRRPAIVAKLRRFPNMQLDRMQDIGGVRAVVNTIDDARLLHEALLRGCGGHPLLAPSKDYIAKPKADGYRSIHLVFKYCASNHEEPDGLPVEIQIRTRLQHDWATAVETLGVFEKTSFKTGMGDERFKRFFLLASALIAMEEKAPVADSLKGKSSSEIAREFAALERDLGVFEKLTAFAAAIGTQPGVENTRQDGFYLLMLDTERKTTSFIPFAKNQQEIAEEIYSLLEQRENENTDVVLAAAGGIKNLRAAYPSYFADAASFVSNLKRLCAENQFPVPAADV